MQPCWQAHLICCPLCWKACPQAPYPCICSSLGGAAGGPLLLKVSLCPTKGSAFFPGGQRSLCPWTKSGHLSTATGWSSLQWGAPIQLETPGELRTLSRTPGFLLALLARLPVWGAPSLPSHIPTESGVHPASCPGPDYTTLRQWRHRSKFPQACHCTPVCTSAQMLAARPQRAGPGLEEGVVGRVKGADGQKQDPGWTCSSSVCGCWQTR